MRKGSGCQPRSARQRDAPDASGRLGYSIEGQESRALLQRQFNSRQPSGLNKLAIKLSGCMDASFVLVLPFQGGIKIPLQDFVLKMQGGLMREGGRICGILRY